MASIKLAGDTSGEVTISAPAVAGTTTLTLPATSSTLATQNALGVRNLIINGDMRIDQRNAGSSVTPANNDHCLDRYRNIVTQSSKYSVQQVTDAPSDFTHSLKVTSLSAYSITSGDIFAISQRIEGQNISHLNWGTANAKTVTLSFWVKSSLTGTFGGAFRNNDANRDYPFSYTINSANTWEQKSITISGDTTGTWLTNNGIGIRLSFGFGVGSTYSGTAGAWASSNIVSSTGATSVVGTSGATWQITGVQLEVGDTATPFEHRPYDMELARCQRYFQSYGTSVLVGYWTTGATGFPFKTQMRASPTAYWEYSGTAYRTYRIQDANQYTHSGASAPTSPDFWLYIYNPATTWAQSGSTITSVMVSKATFNAEL